MIKLTIHPTTELLLGPLRKEAPQSILLSGTSGVGLLTIARWLAGGTPILLQPMNVKGEQDENGTISVESIRQLYEQSRTKPSSKRYVIIDNAEAMSHGAQGAFLKLLEEPPVMTYFILTSHTPSKLLPTIRSRTQHIAAQPLTIEQSQLFIEKAGVQDATKKTQLLFLARGLPAELTRLISDPDYFSMRANVISEARQLITATSYQKARLIYKYRQSREDALRLIDSAINIIRYSLTSKPQESAIKQLNALLAAREGISRNQNVMLQLGRAVL